MVRSRSDGDGVTVFSPDAALTGDDLQRIARESIIRFGDDIGNELEFGLTGSDCRSRSELRLQRRRGRQLRA